jgi:hypothetical protein
MAVLLSVGPLGAQEAAAFLLLPATPRAMVMGSVGAEGAGALFDDVGAMAAAGATASLAVQRHVAGTSAATGAVGYGVGGWTLGAGVHLLDYGSIDELIPDPASGGEVGAPTGARVSASDFAVALGAARAIGPLRGGLAVKLVRQQVAGTGGGTVAVDAGIRVPLPARATLSVAVQHLGGRLELAGREAELPALWRAGVALAPVRVDAVELRFVVEIGGTRGSDVAAGAGGEAAWRVASGVTLAGRVGVRSSQAGDEGSPFAIGGALSGERVAIDYAYRGYGALGGAHRVGVSWRGRQR